MNTIIIPTWNNYNMLVRCLESIRSLTREAEYRVFVVDNGSTDETPNYLKALEKQGYPLCIYTNKTNEGFVKATNRGTREAGKGDNICWMNDDTQVVDGLWLHKLECDLQDPTVGMAVPISNYVMHLQRFDQSYELPEKHFTNLVVYFVGLMRWDVFEKVGYLDERFGIGGNDDMDFSIRLRDAGYKLLVDRTVFCYHYGSQTLLRDGDQKAYEDINTTTRQILIDKWGQAKVDWLFKLDETLIETGALKEELVFNVKQFGALKEEVPEPFGRNYFETTTVRPYRRDGLWLAYFYRRAAALVYSLQLPIGATVLDAGCAMGMEVEALRMMGCDAWGIDTSEYALEQAREDMRPYLFCDSIDAPLAIPPNGTGERRYDLILCVEVLEHLHKADSESALENLCHFTDAVLFSSTPTDHAEPTHYNVQEPAYWHLLFAQQGFMPDLNFDARFITDWATLYRRTPSAN